MRVELSGIRLGYGDSVVLDDVGLTIDHHEWIAMIGPNGAGKSSLLKVLGGLVTHDGGVTQDGRDRTSMSRREVARSIAYVSQHPVMPADMTVSEYVLLGRTPHIGLLAAETASDLTAVGEALRLLELDGVRDRQMNALSGGEQQRAVLARAVAQEPALLLLDEPTAALDIGHQQHALELIDAIRHSHGMSVVSVLHDLTMAGQVADRIVGLSAGRIRVHGAPRQVLTAPTITDLFGTAVEVLDTGDRLVVLPRPVRRRLPEHPDLHSRE
jgi:iron complex transport system ATP-binding protein